MVGASSVSSSVAGAAVYGETGDGAVAGASPSRGAVAGASPSRGAVVGASHVPLATAPSALRVSARAVATELASSATSPSPFAGLTAWLVVSASASPSTAACGARAAAP
jgi:hypothetical protein